MPTPHGYNGDDHARKERRFTTTIPSSSYSALYCRISVYECGGGRQNMGATKTLLALQLVIFLIPLLVVLSSTSPNLAVSSFPRSASNSDGSIVVEDTMSAIAEKLVNFLGNCTLPKQAKLFELPETRLEDAIGGRPFTGLNRTLAEVLEILADRPNHCQFYTFGGTSRALLSGQGDSLHEMDSLTNCSLDQVLEDCGNALDLEYCHLVAKGVVARIADESYSIDVTSDVTRLRIDQIEVDPLCEKLANLPDLDYTINAVVMIGFGVLRSSTFVIDLTGTGVEDCQNRQFRIPVPKSQWISWARGNPAGSKLRRHIKKLFRFYYMQLKGYQPVKSESLFVRSEILRVCQRHCSECRDVAKTDKFPSVKRLLPIDTDSEECTVRGV